MKTDLFLLAPDARAYGRGSHRITHAMPPLGLACINGLVKANGFETCFVDMAVQDATEAALVEQVARVHPRFVGITAVTTQIMAAVQLAQSIKRTAPDVVTVLGGPHPSALPELTASYPGVDVVVAGEGEMPMLELLAGHRWEEISGLAWTHNGVVRSTPRPPLIADLDALPLPDYEGLNIDRYRHIYLPKGIAMPVMSGRGCPYRCIFCASDAVSQRKCRFLSPARFVDHIEELMRRYGVRNFDFADETFVLRPARVHDICEEILRRRLAINWVCQTRVNGIEDSTVAIMKRAGCRRMQLGIESGDQRILDLVGKGIEKESIRRSCATIQRAGVSVTGFFILGLPHDTPETIRRTIEFVTELPLDLAQFSMFVPLPGSEGWEVALDGRVLRMRAGNWDDFSRYTYPIVESDALSREQLKALHGAALRRFYFRPKMMATWLPRVVSGGTLRTLAGMATSFVQIALAKQSPQDPSQMPVLTRETVGRLIGSLGQEAGEAGPVGTEAPYESKRATRAGTQLQPAAVS